MTKGPGHRSPGMGGQVFTPQVTRSLEYRNTGGGIAVVPLDRRFVVAGTFQQVVRHSYLRPPPRSRRGACERSTASRVSAGVCLIPKSSGPNRRPDLIYPASITRGQALQNSALEVDKHVRTVRGRERIASGTVLAFARLLGSVTFAGSFPPSQRPSCVLPPPAL